MQVVSALQIWPATSNTDSVPTSLPALLLVVTINIALKIQEDRLRHRSDKQANTAHCRRLVNSAFVDSVWTEVVVGDVLKICNRENLPADVVLLACYEPDATTLRGACHVETMQLDGETNLKGKMVPAGLVTALGSPLSSARLPSRSTPGGGEADASTDIRNVTLE